MDVIKLNDDLQKEAKELLDKILLVDILSHFGEIVVGGSYVYGTMVDRDIDINVIIDEKSLNYTLRQSVIDTLLEIENLDGIAMTDRYHNQKASAPKGIWFGPIINHENNRWNIDIWFVTQDEPNAYHNIDLHMRMLNITEDQRTTILNIKYDALNAGTKEKGVTSSKIYKAVLDDNITTYEEFINQTN